MQPILRKDKAVGGGEEHTRSYLFSTIPPSRGLYSTVLSRLQVFVIVTKWITHIVIVTKWITHRTIGLSLSHKYFYLESLIVI